MRGLLAWCVEAERAGGEARVASLIEAILRQHERDAREFSDVLELSAQLDGANARFLRFSYGLPRYAADPSRTAAELLALAATLGEGIAAAAERVTRACRSAAVAHPIFGYAHDSVAPRAKLYLQFHDHAEPSAAAALAGRLLGRPIDVAPGPLHLIGLDLSMTGRLTGAKLYHRAPLPPGMIVRLGATPDDALAIRRIDDPDPSAPIPAAYEHDFALAPPRLVWSELRTRLPLASALAPLEAAWALHVRRVSLDVNTTRLTVYYVPE